MSGGGLWVVVVLLVIVGVVAFFVVRRQRYLGELARLGWTHDANPELGSVLDLHAPPFGLGLAREVDELITGTTPGGFGFRVFEYDYSGAGRRYHDRLGVLSLPVRFEEVFLAAAGDGHRAGLAQDGLALSETVAGGLSAVAADAGLAGRVLAAVGGTLSAWGGAGRAVDVSIEGGSLVSAGAPKDPQELAAWLASLDPVAQALAPLGGPVGAGPAAGFGFWGHPDWRYLGSSGDVLDTFPVSEGGFGHEVVDLVRGERDQIRLDAFTHEWKTTRVETYTDSQGRTQTRTVTDHHSEAVCGFLLPFALPVISVNGGWVGSKVGFESTDFNKAFKVRAENARFASDVIHPRMMEWLLATRPPGWTVQGQVVTFEVGEHDLLLVDCCEATLRGWLGRIPRFVWQDLGVGVPPFLVE